MVAAICWGAIAVFLVGVLLIFLQDVLFGLFGVFAGGVLACAMPLDEKPGPSAVRLARDTRPDVLVLDIMMPGFDGVEALGRIRAFLASRPETAEGEVTLPMLTCVLRARRR